MKTKPNPDSVTSVQGWTIHHYTSLDSTNLFAADLPVWSAIVAQTQTAGRGRFQRNWVSDKGGLWMSAVVPIQTNSAEWRLLPLTCGLAVCELLTRLGVSSIRMRWPNDVLVGKRKLAGLLIDQFKPGTAVVGIGINVHNQPETIDHTLSDVAIRLDDLIFNQTSLDDLAAQLLKQIRRELDDLELGRSENVLQRINYLWEEDRPVELDLDGKLFSGIFTGVNIHGQLILKHSDGQNYFFDPQQVKHLKELS